MRRKTLLLAVSLAVLMCLSITTLPQAQEAGPAKEEAKRVGEAPREESKTAQDAPPRADRPLPTTGATQEPKAGGPPEPQVARAYDEVIQLTLEDAVRMALENNLDLKVTYLDDDISKRELIVAKAVFDPFFNLGASFAKNRDPSASFLDVSQGQGVSVSPSETLTYSAGLSGKWLAGTTYEVRLAQLERDRPRVNPTFTLLNPVTTTEAFIAARQPLLKGAWFGVNSADIRIAENNSRFSREQVELSAMQTVFEVEQSYWALVFASQNLEAKIKAYQVTNENLENVRIRKAVGTLAAIDVTTAESQAALRRVELEEALQLRETSRDRILQLINYSKGRSLKEHWEAGSKLGTFERVMINCTTPPSSDELPATRDVALSTAFQRRPEYRQLELNVDNQQIRIEVAKNQMLPSLDLLGRWAQLGLEDGFQKSYNEFDSGRYYDWEVGIEFSVPLTNRGPRAIYRNARDQLRKLTLNKNELENLIVLEVDQAIRKIEFLRRKVVDLEERVRLQEDLLRAEYRKVSVGMSIAYTVSVIENDLVENQTQALRAKADLQFAKAELLRAMGTLFDRFRITVDSPKSP